MKKKQQVEKVQPTIVFTPDNPNFKDIKWALLVMYKKLDAYEFYKKYFEVTTPKENKKQMRITVTNGYQLHSIVIPKAPNPELSPGAWQMITNTHSSIVIKKVDIDPTKFNDYEKFISGLDIKPWPVPKSTSLMMIKERLYAKILKALPKNLALYYHYHNDVIQGDDSNWEILLNTTEGSTEPVVYKKENRVAIVSTFRL